MKNKLLLLLALFIGTMINAQIRVNYELTYKIDSTSDKVQTEWFSLDIENNSSKFYPTSFVVMDSLVAARSYNKTKDFQEPNIFFYVEKEENQLSFLEAVSISFFKVDEPRTQQWELLPDTVSQVEGMVTHKAKADFAGRTWIAEYTNDIPIPEGPYKFKGLPGLILNIKDTADSYEFKFMGVKEIEKSFTPKTFEVLGLKIAPISFDEYNKILSEIETNPKVIAYMITGNYDAALPKEFVDQLVERYKKEKITKNNKIELTFD